MQVTLRVVGGPNTGKEFKIPVDYFLIGRGDDCHLKPKSDMISRRHCALKVEDTVLKLEEFGSKNGTFVNGERVDGSMDLKMGDEIKIGPLEFLVLVDHSLGGKKRSKVNSVSEAASRVASDSVDDSDVDSWLTEGDDAERQGRIENPEDRQFKVDETTTISMEQLEELNKLDDPDEAAKNTKTGFFKMFGGKKKKEFGKLPDVQGADADSSQDAAQDTLKKMFERR
ncbi:MAG: FHA domain-containing protein [Pirellulales bacterium]